MVETWWGSYRARPTALYGAPEYIRVWLLMAAKWTPQDSSSRSPAWHLKALIMSAFLNPLEAEACMGLKMGQV